MAPETNARAVALTEMRKQRQRERHARSHDDDVEITEAEVGIEEGRSPGSEPSEDDALEAAAASGPGSETEPTHDLDWLGQEIERSLTGSRSAENAQLVNRSNAAAPPSRNATPEDILGLQTQLYEQVEESRPATDPEGPTSTRVSPAEAAPPPMEDFEERAAMAKEVLRATSDQPRRSRRAPKVEPPDEESVPEETEGVGDEDVRFSEDLTISAKKRPRRKLFGR